MFLLFLLLSIGFEFSRCQNCPPICLPPYARYLQGQCSTTTGASCYMGCERGFDLLGSCFRICSNTGVWSGVPLSCVRQSVQCPQLRLQHNVQYVSGCQNRAGFNCNFHCMNGGQMNGPRSIYCQSSGQWSGQPPSCGGSGYQPPPPQPTCGWGPTAPPPTAPRPVCQQLSPPLNGNFITGYCAPNLGTICQVQCNNGFSPVGANPIQCLQGGWSGQVPQCRQAISCPPLTKPLNGNFFGQCSLPALPGLSCTIQCDAGYVRSGGEATLTCGQNGQWSPSNPPRCQRNSCPIQNPPVNGQISGQCIPGIANEMCIFQCFPGYRVVGNPSLTCQATGQWNGQPPTCQALGCGNEPLPIGGFFETGGQLTLAPCPGIPGSTCTLVCSQGYKLQGQPTTCCQAVGNAYQWSPQVGTCTRVAPVARLRGPRLRLPRALEREGTTRRPRNQCVTRKAASMGQRAGRRKPR